jgi:hypothetical protein
MGRSDAARHTGIPPDFGAIRDSFEANSRCSRVRIAHAVRLKRCCACTVCTLRKLSPMLSTGE